MFLGFAACTLMRCTYLYASEFVKTEVLEGFRVRDRVLVGYVTMEPLVSDTFDVR